jgi:asparagine synthase (glutamine-hydrolysing)
LPFFDSSFLELVVSMPIDICLKHKFYVKWLSHFSPSVTAIPWQVYPGHQPCPVPVPDGLEYQWSAKYQTAEQAARKRQVVTQAKALFSEPHFPRAVLDRRDLRLAAWMHATGLRDYGYLIGPAHTYHHYSQKCGGRYELPDD